MIRKIVVSCSPSKFLKNIILSSHLIAGLHQCGHDVEKDSHMTTCDVTIQNTTSKHTCWKSMAHPIVIQMEREAERRTKNEERRTKE